MNSQTIEPCLEPLFEMVEPLSEKVLNEASLPFTTLYFKY